MNSKLMQERTTDEITYICFTKKKGNCKSDAQSEILKCKN